MFRGSFSLDAAEAVCEANFDGLESLVEKSLVRRWGSGRLGLLDTIREYALERLNDSPEVAELRRRHAEVFLAVAEESNLNAGKLRPGGQRLELAIAEQDNIRTALTWALATGSIRFALELATAVEQFWVTHDPREGMRWFATALERPEAADVPPDVRAHALRAYGSSLGIGGRYEDAERLFEQSLALFEQLGDDPGQAVLLHRLGLTAMWRGDLESARELVEASDEIHRRTNDRWGQAQTVGTLGAIARDVGHEEAARARVSESAALAREVGVPWWEAGMLAELSALALSAGELDEAETSARESLDVADRLRDRAGRVFGIGLLACVAAERGQPERAGRLWAVIEDEDAGAPLGGWRRHRASCETRIRAAASAEFERGYAVGRELTLEDAVAVALGRRAASSTV